MIMATATRLRTLVNWYNLTGAPLERGININDSTNHQVHDVPLKRETFEPTEAIEDKIARLMVFEQQLCAVQFYLQLANMMGEEPKLLPCGVYPDLGEYEAVLDGTGYFKKGSKIVADREGYSISFRSIEYRLFIPLAIRPSGAYINFRNTATIKLILEFLSQSRTKVILSAKYKGGLQHHWNLKKYRYCISYDDLPACLKQD
jgi:hypothetical protein